MGLKNRAKTKDAILENKDFIDGMIKQVEGERDKVLNWVRDHSSKAEEAVKEEANKRMETLQKRVDTLQLVSVDLSTDKLRSSTQNLLHEGEAGSLGGSAGTELTAAGLISFLRLDHGIMINRELDGLNSPRTPLVQLTADFTDNIEEIQDQLLLVKPRESAHQRSYESDNVSSVQTNKKVVHAFGSSESTSHFFATA